MFVCVCLLFVVASPLKTLRSFRCKEKSLWFTLKILFCLLFLLVFVFVVVVVLVLVSASVFVVRLNSKS